ncbi:MAG: hypothetical protein WC773_02280 [Patescibacteria group bacterium]|jgi:hypothetical protein
MPDGNWHNLTKEQDLDAMMAFTADLKVGLAKSIAAVVAHRTAHGQVNRLRRRVKIG